MVDRDFAVGSGGATREERRCGASRDRPLVRFGELSCTSMDQPCNEHSTTIVGLRVFLGVIDGTAEYITVIDGTASG